MSSSNQRLKQEREKVRYLLGEEERARELRKARDLFDPNGTGTIDVNRITASSFSCHFTCVKYGSIKFLPIFAKYFKVRLCRQVSRWLTCPAAEWQLCVFCTSGLHASYQTSDRRAGNPESNPLLWKNWLWRFSENEDTEKGGLNSAHTQLTQNVPRGENALTRSFSTTQTYSGNLKAECASKQKKWLLYWQWTVNLLALNWSSRWHHTEQWLKETWCVLTR